MRRVDHSSRGVLPNVACMSVINTEDALAHWGCQTIKNLFPTIRNISPFSCVRDRRQACDVTARSTVARLNKLHRRFTKIGKKFMSSVVISRICLLIFFSYVQKYD